MPWIGGAYSGANFSEDFDLGRLVLPPPLSPDCDAARSRDICPTLEDCHAQILAMLPRGRAWRTEAGGVRWRFFRALAALVVFANEALCAFADEMFCDTTGDLAEAWRASYGLPDSCDPYARLCDKIAATGGQTCAYLVAMAARAGFAVECVDLHGAEASCAEAGCAEAHPPWSVEGMLGLRVDQAGSPALGSSHGTPVDAGLLEAGQAIYCGADLSALQCLMDRIAPAHLLIVYIVV